MKNSKKGLCCEKGHVLSWLLVALALFYLGYLLMPLMQARKGKISFHNGRRVEEVSYHYYVPRVKERKKLPVVVGVGGLDSSGMEYMTHEWLNFARQQEVAVVSVGFKNNEDDWKKRQSYQYPQAWSGRALLKILEEIASRESIDPGQLYLTGLSAGAQFVIRFTLWRPDLCRATAGHSAGIYDLPSGFLPVKFLATMGDSDSVRMPGVQAFVAACKAAGIDVQFKVFPNFGHGRRPEQDQMSRALFSEVLKEHKPVSRSGISAEKVAPPVTSREMLIQAVWNNDMQLLNQLLDAGHDVDTQTVMGYTLLMEAAAIGYTDIVKVLLSHGADIAHIAPDGKGALELAEENQRLEIKELLQSKMQISR